MTTARRRSTMKQMGLHNLEQLKAQAPAVAGGGVSGLVGGAVIANQFFPPSLELAPGVDVQPSIALGGQGVVATYKSYEMTAPHVPVHLPLLPGNVHIDITNFNVPFNEHGLKTVAALGSQYHTAISDPIQAALIERLALGGGIGLALGGSAVYLARQKLQERSLGERIKARPRRALAVALASCLALVAGGEVFTQLPDESSAHPTLMTSAGFSQQYPMLRDAIITGPDTVPHDLAVKALDYADGVNRFWQRGARNFDRSFALFAGNGNMTIAQNPDIVSIMHVSDLHCDYPNYRYYLPRLIEKLQPNIVLNSGDTYSNSATMPYEKNCFHDFVGAVATANRLSGNDTKIVNVAGNHDPKRPFNGDNPQVISLSAENGYQAIVDDITFVGAPDLAVSTWGPTQPANPQKRGQLVVQQGSTIADVACQLLDKTGQAPVVAAHSDAAGFETAERGCASLIETGHTHIEKPVQKYTANNGRVVLQQTVGTASGSVGGLTFEQAAGRNAPVMMQYFNTDSREFVKFVSVTLHTDATVGIQIQKTIGPSSLPYTHANVEAYLEAYSKKPAAGQALVTYPH